MIDDTGQASTSSLSSESPSSKRGISRRAIATWLIAVVLAEVLASGITWSTVPQRSQTPVAGPQPVGQVVWLSSPHAPPGFLDEVVLTLQNVPDAPADSQYYAWLLNHESTLPVHWTFTVDHGHVFSSYIDPQHMNLLTKQSYLFLITLQNVQTTIPSFDPSERRYYASIPQTLPLINGLSLVVLPCPQNSSNTVCDQ